MAKNKKPREPYMMPADLPPVLRLKREADTANAYNKTAGRMGKIGNNDARRMARQVGIVGR